MMEDSMRRLTVGVFCVVVSLLLGAGAEAVFDYLLILSSLLKCVWCCLLGCEIDSLLRRNKVLSL